MREILFRGKRIDKSEWVYGSYCYAELLNKSGYEHLIIEQSAEGKSHNVVVESVGQYTGLTDKNGTKIFEGDIVKNEWCFIKGNSIVRFGEYKSLDSSNNYQCGHLGFYLEHISDFNKRTVRKDIMYFANKCEIIGNVFDNPEMLEV